jgi:hypothetical protein
VAALLAEGVRRGHNSHSEPAAAVALRPEARLAPVYIQHACDTAAMPGQPRPAGGREPQGAIRLLCWEYFHRDSACYSASSSQLSFRLVVYPSPQYIAYPDQLDLDKPAERVAAQTKLFAGDPGLYKRYAAANTVRVGKVLMTD